MGTFLTRLAGAILDRLDHAIRLVAGLLLIAVTLIIFLNASGRFLIGASFLGGEELARLLIIWATFLGAFSALRIDAHVAIDLGLRRMGPGLQRVVRGVTAAVGIAICAYLCFTSYQLTVFSFRSGQMGSTLPILRGFFFLPVVVGSGLMAVAFGEKFVRALTGTLPQLPSLIEESAGTPTDDRNATR
jgi:TRAP-type C4-dicarboxylate transport system permease small subunit